MSYFLAVLCKLCGWEKFSPMYEFSWQRPQPNISTEYLLSEKHCQNTLQDGLSVLVPIGCVWCTLFYWECMFVLKCISSFAQPLIFFSSPLAFNFLFWWYVKGLEVHHRVGMATISKRKRNKASIFAFFR